MSGEQRASENASLTINPDLYFKTSLGKEIPIHKNFVYLSGFLEAMVKSGVFDGPEEKIVIDAPEQVSMQELEFINKIVDILVEQFDVNVKRERSGRDYWFEFVVRLIFLNFYYGNVNFFQPEHKNKLRPVFDNVDKDLIISTANASDFLMMPSVMAMCTFFLCENSLNMNLAQLRDYLNETDDFDDEQSRLINECSEFTVL